MNQTPKANRLHIGIFGRTNAGKSSLLNYVAGQEVAITSPVPGTTTDVVEKTMELLPLGPVVFLDTAGLDDVSVLAEQRLRKTRAVFQRSDVVLLVLEPETWGAPEEEVVSEAAAHKTPVIGVINKTDVMTPTPSFLSLVRDKTGKTVSLSCLNTEGRETAVAELKKHLISVCPEEFLSPPPIVGDLLPAGGMVVLVVPIDLQAPKGRLILPQVQTLRDALDHDAASLVVKEREYASSLQNLVRPPDLVVCDSQVVLKVTADTPPSIRCTTFSTLFARAKGDLTEMARGAAVLNRLRPGDRILVAEACSHHPLEDDIGRVKIPRWLTRHVGGEMTIDVCSGKDFPDNLRDYRLVVHCGGCMLTRREMLSRIQCCRQAGVPITNYGVAISVMHGVADRVLAPFPSAREVFHHEQDKPRR
ncbi:MAG TPA: [FeFe] hydrogenase H-cluster maturation GTPase HydF [Elusimicrobiota bacterium]|nr:[FeFe] hydrogenase H-cluster maturation GTPase HydF [Elusimicrobiota bacterium]